MIFKIILHDCWDVVENCLSIEYPEVFDTESEAIEKAMNIIFNEFERTFRNIDRIDDFREEFYLKRDRPEVRSAEGMPSGFDPYEVFEDYLSKAIWFDAKNPQTIFQETLRLAAEWHKGQIFPGTDLPYLYHIACVANEIYAAKMHEAVANEFNLKYALSLALLHDILEDTEFTEKALMEQYGPFTTWGVKALTKDKTLPKNQAMEDSIKRIRHSPKEVAMVKMADRITNLLPPPKHWTSEKLRKYHEESLFIHGQLAGRSPYLGSRLADKIREYERYF